MGLDMWMFGKEHRVWTEDPDATDLVESSEGIELAYWRKHPNLHGYIVQQFAGGVDKCQNIPLTATDLLDIIEAVKGLSLPHTEGFFFGQSHMDEDEIALDMDQLSKVLDWLKEDTKLLRTIHYQASW